MARAVEPTPQARREMQGSMELEQNDHAPPSVAVRLRAVWLRHWLVYRSTLVANSLPAFAEPVLFLVAIGLGLGQFIEVTFKGGIPYGAFMGPGVLGFTAMFTAVFETTFGTFVRLVYQKTYAAMICTPLTARDCFLGELVWCGTKGFAFSIIVGIVYLIFGALSGAGAAGSWFHLLHWTAIFVPIIGFITAFLFGAFGLLITARIQNLNNFNFFLTGVITPMSYFSGALFPVDSLPSSIAWIPYVLPLFHATEINRFLMFGYEACDPMVIVSPFYLLIVTPLLTWYAIRAITKRVQQ